MQILDAIDRPAVDRLRSAGEYFWLDLVDPSPDALDAMCELFDIGDLVAEDLHERDQRPKLDDYDSYVHGVFYGIDGESLVEVHFIIHGDAVVTVRPAGCAPLAGVRTRVAQVDTAHEEQAIYFVLDALTDSFFPLLLERMGDEIDDIEDTIVSAGGRHAPALQAFAARRRRLSALRRVVGPQRDMLAGAGDFVDRVPGLRADAAHDYFRDVYDHLLRIGDELDALRDMLTSIHDIYLSAQSNRLNEVVYRLTVVGTIFLPITFVTGFFGQNFRWLTDRIGSGPAFWGLGLGLELASVAVLLAWFRRAGVRQ